MIVLQFNRQTTNDALLLASRTLELAGFPPLTSDDSPTHRNLILKRRPGDDTLHALSGLENVTQIDSPYLQASRQYHPENTHIIFPHATLGAAEPFLIAGPCSVEDRVQFLESVQAVREAGAQALRGAIYKPRTSPYSFQGIGAPGVDILLDAKAQTGLPIFTEVLSVEHARITREVSDAWQIGARNMQNFELLKELANTQKPILLKRGMGNTIDELLLAAEYLLKGGNKQVALCERGIRSFEPSTRFTFDLNAIPVLKKKTHLPILADPSHAAGEQEYVESIGLAAIAAGADGLLVEVHISPENSLSDSEQTLTPEQFHALVKKARNVKNAIR